MTSTARNVRDNSSFATCKFYTHPGEAGLDIHSLLPRETSDLGTSVFSFPVLVDHWVNDDAYLLLLSSHKGGRSLDMSSVKHSSCLP